MSKTLEEAVKIQSMQIELLLIVISQLSKEDFLKGQYNLDLLNKVQRSLYQHPDTYLLRKVANDESLFEKVIEISKEVSVEQSVQEVQRIWSKKVNSFVDYENLSDEDEDLLDDSRVNPFEGI